jgi:O-antigen ligase
MKFLSYLGIGSSVYGLFQSWGSDPITWNNPGNKVILTLGNSNFASALMALTAIACIVYFVSIRSFTKRLLLILFFLVQVYLILKSEAVQGLITLFFGTSLFVGLLLLFSKRKIFRRISLLWWTILFAFGIIGLLSLFRLGPLADLMSPYLFSFRDRYYHWVAAINMMREHPFFGVGIDSFGDFYRQYRVQEAIDVRGTASFATNNAHNTFLQFGATGGLVLLVAYMTLILFIGYRSIVALKFCHNKTLVSGVFSVWVTFQVQTLVSIDQIGIVIWGWILGGCLVSASYYLVEEGQEVRTTQAKNKSNRIHVQKQKSVSALVLLVCLVPALTLVPTLFNEYALKEDIVSLVSSSTTADFNSRSVKVVLSAEKSRHPELRLQAANYLLQVGLNDEALVLTRLNNLEFPSSFESWDATARILEGVGDKEQAAYPRQRSVELDPLNLEIKKLLETDQAKN